MTRRIRMHEGFSHILANGTDADPGCLSCRRDQKAARLPVIMISARPVQEMPDYGSGQFSLGVTTVCQPG